MTYVALLPTISQSTVSEVVESSARPASEQIQEGARAIAKKRGHAERRGYRSAFEGAESTQRNAEMLIRNILMNPEEVVSGKNVVDVYDALGRGDRFAKQINEFMGFLKAHLRTR